MQGERGMPGKNTRKIYVENGYYHVYNRGVEKRSIFMDVYDYTVFLSILKEYLSPRDEKSLSLKLIDSKLTTGERNKIWHSIRRKNFSNDITLMAYCLMPNHFHLFIKQNTPKSLNQFMGALSSSYSLYFNHKYKRVGTLYEGVYKAVLINDEGQFLHVSRYIHKQALSLQGEALQEIQPSSWAEYTGTRRTTWIHPEEILAHFSNEDKRFSYLNFVKEWKEEEQRNLEYAFD
jgi:putative transposase